MGCTDLNPETWEPGLLCWSGRHTIVGLSEKCGSANTIGHDVEPMLNYRLVATLLLLCIVVFRMATQWAIEPDGNWFRPFVVWAMIVFAAYVAYSHRVRDES